MRRLRHNRAGAGELIGALGIGGTILLAIFVLFFGLLFIGILALILLWLLPLILVILGLFWLSRGKMVPGAIAVIAGLVLFVI